MPTLGQIHADINEILETSSEAGTVLDELTILRAALRAWMEGKPPADAVAWAAQQLSNAITK